MKLFITSLIVGIFAEFATLLWLVDGIVNK
jgi:hypothetical protein